MGIRNPFNIEDAGLNLSMGIEVQGNITPDSLQKLGSFSISSLVGLETPEQQIELTGKLLACSRGNISASRQLAIGPVMVRFHFGGPESSVEEMNIQQQRRYSESIVDEFRLSVLGHVEFDKALMYDKYYHLLEARSNDGCLTIKNPLNYTGLLPSTFKLGMDFSHLLKD